MQNIQTDTISSAMVVDHEKIIDAITHISQTNDLVTELLKLIPSDLKIGLMAKCTANTMEALRVVKSFK